jgi:hypothetical protein
MRIPPTPERIKEAPAQALRALFAGVGQVLLITERVRRRALGPQDAPADPARDIRPPVPAPSPAEAAQEPAADISPHVPAPAPSPAGAAEDPVADISPPVPAPSPAEAAEDPVADIAPAAADHDDLPLAGYGELSFASLRARLRGLDLTQVRVLLDYERAHENRENVTTMFERRIAKLEAESGSGSAGG